jgi:hypothetical protein
MWKELDGVKLHITHTNATTVFINMIFSEKNYLLGCNTM